MMDADRLMPLLADYLDRVDVVSVAGDIAAAMGSDLSVAQSHLVTHMAEARVALRLVGPAINAGSRVLEVGSGIGLFAGFLRSLGIDVTELEPVGMGFQFIGKARSALAPYTHPSAHLDIGVEELTPDKHGSFDLVYSLNVLEHVPDWQAALAACAVVLNEGGQMVHEHPNYSVPFEPHFNVLLVPFRPALTSRLLPKRIADSETWKSLNWISASRVKRWCRSNGFEVEFCPGVLADTLDRLTSDPLFGSRHRGVVGRAAALATRAGLTRPLKWLPASLNTPVEYRMWRTR